MQVNSQLNGDVVILMISGRFDSHEVAQVKEHLNKAIEESPNVLIDMAEVSFMDSAALAVLVQGMKHCRQGNGDLRICNLKQPVRIIFELTRLDKAFQLFDSRKAAVESFM